MSRFNSKALAFSKGLFIVIWFYSFTLAYAVFTGTVSTEKRAACSYKIV